MKDEVRKNEEDDPVGVSQVAIVLKDADPADEAEDPGALSFEEDLSSTVFDGMVGTAIDEIELPEAVGSADGDRTYGIANLPAGLVLDEDTQTISGTPTAEGESVVVYTVIDAEGASVATTSDIAAEADPTIAVAEVSVSQSSIRESGETAEISVKATLAEASPIAGTIRFTIGAPSVGTEAVRDVDYTASLTGSVAVEEGATSATSTLTLTPINNEATDGNRVLGVHAAGSRGSASADITIADDETASTSISLSADPHTVSEDAGVTEVTVSAVLDGKVLGADATVTLSVDPASEATRDVDYSALFNPLLTIPAGEVSGSVALLIDPTADSADEGDETITLNGTIEGLLDGSGTLTISDVEAMEDEMMALMFAEGAMIDDIAATAGTEITAVELPAAEGGSGDIAYSVSDLPTGLSFDPAFRHARSRRYHRGHLHGDRQRRWHHRIDLLHHGQSDVGLWRAAIAATGSQQPSRRHRAKKPRCGCDYPGCLLTDYRRPGARSRACIKGSCHSQALNPFLADGCISRNAQACG